MNTASEETPRAKSSGSAGSSGKNRRHSIGITSSGKSSGEEVNSVPNYLRASTGSCHDFCKYGKHHENVKSAIPIKFKRTPVVNKEKVAKTVVPVEKKKTTTVAKVNPKLAEPVEVTKKDAALLSKKTQKAQVMKRSLSTNGKAAQNEPKMFQRSTSLVKPSPVTVNRDASAGSNAGIKKKEIKTVKKAEATPKTGPAKKLIPKATLTDSRSQKASFSRAESLKAIKSKSAKQVAPLKDQNRMQKSEPKQTRADKVQTQALQDGEAESEVNIEAIEFDFIDSSMELKDPLTCDSSLVQIEALDGFETEPEVKHETMEFDFIHPSVCNESEAFSCNDIGEEESLITDTVYESSELIPDEELPEDSTITPTVIEISPSSSNEDVLEEDMSVYESSEVFPDRKPLEESAIRPTVEGTQSSSDNEVLDEDPLITHTAYVSSELILDEESSISPAAVVSVRSSSDKEDLGEDSMITHPVHESSELLPDKELLEESSIASPVVESSHASSDKEVSEEESLIAPPVFESTQDEDESEYTDDDDEVEVSEDESESSDDEKEVAAAQNDEMKTTAGVQDKVRRKGRGVISEDKDDKGVKLKFRRGKILDIQSENNGPRRLKFRKRVIEGNEDGQSMARRTYKNKTSDVQTETDDPSRLKFKEGKVKEGNEEKKGFTRRSFEKKHVEETKDSKNGPESVVLKHQGEKEKKDAQGLLNNVIEETASKLAESRKSKVKALVGAFETVISLQDGKPSST
ncbi:ribonuclease H-like domain-containing protein [Tanacetum coccineum]